MCAPTCTNLQYAISESEHKADVYRDLCACSAPVCASFCRFISVHSLFIFTGVTYVSTQREQLWYSWKMTPVKLVTRHWVLFPENILSLTDS